MAIATTVETSHEDQIHDCQLDWYGKRLATCSSDRTIRVFDVEGEGQYHLVDTLHKHTGPVWQVAWAHPKFGSILASCGYDGNVYVWRETPNTSTNMGGAVSGARWETIKEHSLHNASVNSIAWAPHELGAILACASSDGKVSVLKFEDDGTWQADIFPAHNIGCNAVSWAPAVVPGSLTSPVAAGANPQANYQKKIVTGGCDGLVKIWNWRNDDKTWAVEETLEGHEDWVRDAAWAPSIGLRKSYIASAGQDKQVLVWTQDSATSPWTKTVLDPSAYATAPPAANAPAPVAGRFPDACWKVSWSISGNVLAVSSGDGKVTLWKENLKGKWENVSEVTA